MESVYHTVAQALGVGFGLGGEPAYMHEQVLGTITFIFGLYWTALITASITTAVSNASHAYRQYRERIDRALQYARVKQLPQELKDKLLFYYHIAYPDGRYFSEWEILAEVPRPLRLNLLAHRCRRLLFYLKVDPDSYFGSLLISELKPVRFIFDSYVIKEEHPSTGLYFIESGSVEVTITGRRVATPGQGEFFGEMALLNPGRRIAKASIRVTDVFEGFRLKPEAFDKLIEVEPSFGEMVRHAAQVRQEQNDETMASDGEGSFIEERETRTTNMTDARANMVNQFRATQERRERRATACLSAEDKLKVQEALAHDCEDASSNCRSYNPRRSLHGWNGLRGALAKGALKGAITGTAPASAPLASATSSSAAQVQPTRV